MHLKTLTLKGFKSFAEPASIRLEPGVTVVVGPNGSGKSNVVDAVAWVLGAQAPSAVRSARMDDVIFAGAANKPALGRAEVSLTIDNSDAALPTASSEVRITRTLFRSGESTYALNGAPCRLLDIVELLSDTGVGRQQHMIVSQSQIDAVLNARPADRRAVVEEAAGILKYRKRRERAERRLFATDGDLTRLSDLLREVRRRLRPLQKQAEAARRHADLLSELEALRVHLAGREITDMREQLRLHKQQGEAQAARQSELRAELDDLHARVVADEQRLARHGTHDHSERLARLEGLRARAAGLAAVAVERRRGIEHQRSALVDHDLAAGLQAELERCRKELSAVVLSAAAADSDRLRLERLQQSLEADRARFGAEWGDVTGSDAGAKSEAAEARGELSALQSTIEHSRGEQNRLTESLKEGERRLPDLAAQADDRRHQLDRCNQQVAAQRAELDAARTDREDASTGLDDAVAARSQAEGDLRHWIARRDALAMALESADRAVPVDAQVAADGVVGLLGDLVEVDDGLEAAFAAAVGDAAGALVVRDMATAGRVLDSMEAGDAGAAVIALGGAAADAAAGAAVERLRLAPLRSRVRAADPDVGRLLDVLLASTVLVEDDWRVAAETWMRHRDLVVVTPAGDRLSARGWRLGVHGAAGLRRALAEAEHRVEASHRAHADAEAACDAARIRLHDSRDTVEEIRGRLAAAESAASSAAEHISRAEADRRELETANSTLRDRLTDVHGRLDEAVRRAAQIESTLPELEAAEARIHQRGREAAEARAALDQRAAEAASMAAEQSATDARHQQRQQMLQARASELEDRLSRHRASRAAAGDRLARLEREVAVLEALARAVEQRTGVLKADLAEIREVRRRQSEEVRALAASLDDLRGRHTEADRRHEALRQAESRRDIEEAELRTVLQGAVERLRDAHGLSPQQAADAPLPELPDGFTPAQRVEQLAAELEIMGPVNPLALTEYDELYERHELLSGQMDDIRAARRDLNRVIRSIDGEIKTVFSSAFLDVATNFELLFEALFPGGEGRLSLTDPDDLLDTGIEISAKPSGKNVKRLSLLSGGERTLAALAFLFAVFRSRPSPFYVMDEVEAALDDVNLHRFLKLIDEFRADAQLLIVTHQKRTMEAADCLQGVSMRPGGSSMVVSERVSDAA